MDSVPPLNPERSSSSEAFTQAEIDALRLSLTTTSEEKLAEMRREIDETLRELELLYETASGIRGVLSEKGTPPIGSILEERLGSSALRTMKRALIYAREIYNELACRNHLQRQRLERRREKIEQLTIDVSTPSDASGSGQ